MASKFLEFLSESVDGWNVQISCRLTQCFTWPYFMQISTLHDFFKDETVFVAYGSERCSVDDFELSSNGKNCKQQCLIFVSLHTCCPKAVEPFDIDTADNIGR